MLIRPPGASYAGLNGLFSSIIYMLSMAELGFGAALIFSMHVQAPGGERHGNRLRPAG